MIASKIINLNNFPKIEYQESMLEYWRKQDNTNNIPDKFVEDILNAYFVRTGTPFSRDSIKILNKKISNNKIELKKKELVSGTARANIENKDVKSDYKFDYTFYCCKENNKFTYNKIEIEPTNFKEI